MKRIVTLLMGLLLVVAVLASELDDAEAYRLKLQEEIQKNTPSANVIIVEDSSGRWYRVQNGDNANDILMRIDDDGTVRESRISDYPVGHDFTFEEVDETPPAGSPPAPGGTVPPPGSGASATTQPNLPDNPVINYLVASNPDAQVRDAGNGDYIVDSGNGKFIHVKVTDGTIIFDNGLRIVVQNTEQGIVATYWDNAHIVSVDDNQDGRPDQQFDPALQITDAQFVNGNWVVTSEYGNRRERFTIEGENLISVDGDRAIELLTNGNTQLAVVHDYGHDNKAGGKDDRYTITLPGEQTLSGEGIDPVLGNLIDGDRVIAKWENGELMTGCKSEDRTCEHPQTVYHQDGSYTQNRYDGNDKLVESSTYQMIGGQQVVREQTIGGNTVQYEYKQDPKTGKPVLDTIKNDAGEVVCSAPCTADKLKQLEENACRTGSNDLCKQIKGIIANFKPGFWARWDAMRRGAAAGAGYCGILDMMGVSCGDSLFPAFDDYMQNTVIGNVLSGETSALCTMWADNPNDGGNVALGAGGYAAAWIAGEYIDMVRTGNTSAMAARHPSDRYLYKLTFQITPSNMVDGKCEQQTIAVKATVDGRQVDLNFDGRISANDTIRLQCDKGGYTATGSRAVVRYVAEQPNTACLEFDGSLNGLFQMALDGNKLCNRIVPIEDASDFSCPECAFGDHAVVTGGPGAEPPENGENRPPIGNPTG